MLRPCERPCGMAMARFAKSGGFVLRSSARLLRFERYGLGGVGAAHWLLSRRTGSASRGSQHGSVVRQSKRFGCTCNLGEVVLDLGSGGGFDVFIAGKKVGATGRLSCGHDRRNAGQGPKNIESYRQTTGLDNVEFRLVRSSTCRSPTAAWTPLFPPASLTSHLTSRKCGAR